MKVFQGRRRGRPMGSNEQRAVRGSNAASPGPRWQRPQREKSMQRMRKYLHLAVIFSMMMTLVAVAFPATVGAANLSITPQSWDFGNVEAGTTSPHVQFTVNNVPG